MSTFNDLVLGLRQPEYTGENRCIPCTVLNTLIAVTVSAILIGMLHWVWSLPATVAIATGIVALVVFLAVISVRGYLVPYTPTITKRYLPDRVLSWFDKAEPAISSDASSDPLDDFDVEAELLAMDVIEPCADVADLCLTPAFQRQLHDRVTDLRGTERESRAEEIRTLLDLDADHDVREMGSASAIVLVDDTRVGQWESEAALIADLAADTVFREWTDDWASRSVAERSQLLNSTRMFLERCPACDSSVTLGQDTVESCCRSRDVIVLACGECNARLFEVTLTPEMEKQLAA